MPSIIRAQIEHGAQRAGEVLYRVYDSLGQRREIRRERGEEPSDIEYTADMSLRLRHVGWRRIDCKG